MTPAGVVGPVEVTARDGRIFSLRPDPGPIGGRHRGTLVPGFVDLQVNGIDDINVATATSDAQWNRLDSLLLDQGTTAWCPTLISAPLDSYSSPLAEIARAQARPSRGRPTILGAHLEGPFLGSRPGAHPQRHVVPFDADFISRLPQVVCMMTIGAEQGDATSATRALRSRGIIVSLGHSAADERHVEESIAAGATMVTHLYNAMGPFNHRSPGLVGRALVDDRVCVSLIADLVHVHPVALQLAFRAKRRGGRILVTDAVAWRDPLFVSSKLSLSDGAPRLSDNTLAGSVLTMDRAVANVVGLGVSLEDAIHAAATAPADVLGISDRGRIAEGAHADFTLLSDDLSMSGVWVAGERVR